MSVPFIDLKRFETGFLERWNKKVAGLSKTASFIGGTEVADLEENLKGWTKTDFAVSCANGTDAIQLALKAVGIEKGDHVLIPNSTFWATFEAVVNVGGIPSTIDVDLIDGGVDVDALKLGINELAPKAVIIAHLYGWGSKNLLEIRTLCTEHNIPLIEDGAQCFGVEIDGESIYKNAFVSTTSFYPAKVFGAAGDAGAVFTNDPEVARRSRMFSNHGRKDHYSYEDVGFNSRMDSFQAAFLNLSMEYLPERIQSRRASVDFYNDILSKNNIQQIVAPSNYKENGYCNVCLVPKEYKTDIQDIFRKAGVGFGNIYPSAMSEQECSAKYLKASFGAENSILLGKTVFNLPLFPYMTDDELSTSANLLIETIKTLK